MVEAATQADTSTSVVTPAGIVVLYEWEPKRLYKLSSPLMGAGGDTHWIEVPSVTTVLGVLDKPGLPYWGNKIGVDGVMDLVRLGLLVVVP